MNVIEINGKLYNAHGGELVGSDQPIQSVNKPVMSVKHASSQNHTKRPQPQRPQQGRSIDGFTKSKRPTAQHQQVTRATPRPTHEAISTPKTVHKAHKPAPRLTHSLQHAHTLHRQSVKKPVFKDTDVHTTPRVTPNPGKDERLKRAMHVTRSPVVHKFSHTQTKVEPEIKKEERKAEESMARDITPPKKQPVAPPTIPAIRTTPTHQPHHEQLKKEAKSTRKQRKHASFIGFATTALTALILVGYVAYLNVPTLSMKIAASRAGFAATLPSYKPAGYNFNGPISYSPGQVTIDFKSNVDQRKFSITQQPTSWDSQALLENYVSKKSPPYTWQDSGLTLYFTDGEATWVNAGKMYKLDTKGSQLGIEQISKLATSM